mmetsp:Transcript_153885/g.271673  ORF Transcript_153885/g.271673 Transcript_153885/m.271673 type:complete len:233 (-) Transcript_153885:381-1079(-)
MVLPGFGGRVLRAVYRRALPPFGSLPMRFLHHVRQGLEPFRSVRGHSPDLRDPHVRSCLWPWIQLQTSACASTDPCDPAGKSLAPHRRASDYCLFDCKLHETSLLDGRLALYGGLCSGRVHNASGVDQKNILPRGQRGTATSLGKVLGQFDQVNREFISVHNRRCRLGRGGETSCRVCVSRNGYSVCDVYWLYNVLHAECGHRCFYRVRHEECTVRKRTSHLEPCHAVVFKA